MDAKIKELLTRLSFFAEDGMADKPIVEIAKQADALLLEVARKPNTQQPAAYMVMQQGCKDGKTFLSEAAAYAELLASPAGSELVNLYPAPPVPRYVLMAALGDAMQLAAGTAEANIDMHGEDSLAHQELQGAANGIRDIDIAAIADRYASQVQPEPVNQQSITRLSQMARDKIIAAAKKAGFDVGEINGESEIFNPHTSDEIPVTAELERFASAVSDPVKQQLLAALKGLCSINDETITQHQRAVRWLKAHEAIAAAEAAQPVGDKTWFDGYPPFPQDQEWFIAITTYGDRVVLRALDKDYSSCQYTTADHTYIKKESIAHWMQFPDCEYLPPKTPQPASAHPVAWCELNGKGEIAYFDGKPIFMPGAVGNECHPVPLFAAQLVAVPATRELTDDELWAIRNHVAINEVTRDDDSRTICIKQGRAVIRAMLSAAQKGGAA